MPYRPTLFILSLYACATVTAISPARAAHAYTMVCCGVPSSVTVIERSTRRVRTFIAGQGAAGVALSSDGKILYVANENDSTISVLNAVTGATTATISLSTYGASPYGVLLSPDGSELYVTAAQNGFVSVLGVATATKSVQFDVQTPGTYATNFSPIPLPPPAISSDGRTLYILASEFMEFDTSSFAVRTISITSGVKHPLGVAVTPDGAYAAITFNAAGTFAAYAGQFALLDLNSQSLVKQISYPKNTTVGGVAISPDSSRAYFAVNSSGNAGVAAFDIATQQVVKIFPAGAGNGVAMAVSPDGSEIELGESSALVVSMAASTGAITGRVGALGFMTALSFAPQGDHIYVPNFDSSMIEAIDPTTSEISNQIPGGWLGLSIYDTFYALVASADGRRLALAGLVNVSFVDTVHQRVIGALPLPGSFKTLALSPDGDRAYLVFGPNSGGADQVDVIDTRTFQVTGSFSLTTADLPSQAVVSPDGATLYISEQNCPSGGGCLPQLLAVDTGSLQITQAIVLSTDAFTPGGVAIANNGQTAYVEGLYFSGGISIVDLVHGDVTATIGAQLGWSVIALSPDQKFIYEAALSNYGFYEIDLTALQSTGISGGNSQCLGLSPDGSLLYLGEQLSSSLAAWSTYPEGSPVFLGSINLPGGTDAVVFAQF